uniref:Integrase catalytic domain-containing protein n=1 Tax=Panagrolaimus davidi TaxID=227884 RepID=A0A914QNJ0_9BILA
MQKLIFDPLGIVAPVVFAGKVFLHSLWVAQHKWDTPLNDDELKKWNKFKEATEGKQIKLRRYIFNKNAIRREIYVFVDASEKGIAAVVYIREILENGEIRVHLIICKTRIAPANYATISRLELMAIVLGAALLKFLLKELPFTVNSTTIFSDSTCAIGWINSSEKQGRFVDNRKNFILEIVTDIQHVRGPDNSADPASRGCTVAELVSCPKWLHGPHWLQLDKKFWPPPTLNHIALERAITPPSSVKEVEQPALSSVSSTIVQENVKNIEEKINSTSKVTTVAVTGNHYFDLGVDAKRISKWQPLIGAVAAMLFFIKNCGKNAASTFLKLLLNVVANSYRHPTMLYFAETSIFLNIQRKFPPSQNVQRELKLKYNELGLLVCSHRIPTATADELIWLPECHETYLLILHIHTKLMHAGPRHTLNELRRRFWICKGKQVVNKVLRRQCFPCRRLKVKPYKLPDMPDLPRERVEMAHPFKYCGVDLCGPYTIKVQQQPHKYWICLFTCMVTRNIHLEICPGLDGHSFILAFRRFVARYVSEIETIINTRPISAVDPEYNPNATNMALRPIDFIASHVTSNYPPSYDPADCTYCDKESTEEVLNKLYQFTAHIRDQFWNKFAHDYLNQLREATTHFHKQSKFTEILPEPGSVVLVEEENIPLNGWKLGVIVALNESDDNCIRTAKVKVPSGRILNRPLCQLYPLEVQVNDPATIQKTPAESESTNDNSTPTESIQPRYNFRPRQKVSKTFFVLALCACLVLGATATECQSSTVELKLVYAENCTSSGLAIFQNVDDSYCWQQVDCGIYHLHDYSQLPGNDNHICTDPCKCPAWADDCTFYESSLSEVEKKSLLNLINDEAPHENDAIVHIIQLPDGTDHVIRQLNLIKEDALDDIICFGSGQTFNGPPNFCANRTCDTNASKLCLIQHHELVFAAVHNGKIPIKAWKTLERPPKIPTFHPQLQLPASCDDGKIFLNNTENIRRVQVQSGNSYTVFIPNSTNLIMELPTALVTASREFKLTYWNKHESYNITQVICPAIDYCTQIKPCWFCTAELLNPECRPVKSILMISNLISLLYIILHKLCKKRRRNRRKSSSLPLFIKRKNSDEDIFVRFRKLSEGAVLPTISICIICIILLPGIEADGEDLSLTAKSQECTVNSHGFASCKISEVTQLTISTAKTSTLLINYEGRPLGSIKIIPEVHLTCQKMTQHYTRIVDIKTASLKICGGRSLCSGNECAMSTSDLRVPAFGTANNLPGNTFCHESCGGC